MMLKTDAKLKWCPFAITWETVQFPPGGISSQSVVAGVNRNGPNAHGNCLCITDKCMAWTSTLGDSDRGHCVRLGYVP